MRGFNSVTRLLLFIGLACFVAVARSEPDPGVTWQQLENANYIVSGTRTRPKSVIYAIFDPDCGFCHSLWLALKPYEAAGLQVRWIPVGFLGRDSRLKAAAVLDGGDAEFEQQQWDFENGAAIRFSVSDDLKSKLDENRELMRAAQIHGTPGILYRDASGHVRKCSGMPKLRALPAITGLPAEPQTDPRLSGFR